MDLSKKKRYDELVEESIYVINKISHESFVGHMPSTDPCLMAAILVSSEHSNSDLGQLAGFIRDNTVAKSITPGQKMKEYRIKHNLSQDQLAKKLGISRPYMSEIESDKRSMSVKTVSNFTDKLGISMSDFFN